MAFSRTLLIALAALIFAGIAAAFQYEELSFDDASAFDGLLSRQELKCNGVIDACGVCNGDGKSCIGCDGIRNSGMEWDDCGVCGGNNACKGCDGNNGVEDWCGVCRGDGSTCGGCDGEGSVYDDCGVCGGDNSTCKCVKYHGFYTKDMNYMLTQYLIDQTLWKIENIKHTILVTMEDLETYQGSADLGIMVEFLNDFCEGCLATYSLSLDEFTYQVKQSIGLESTKVPFVAGEPF